MLLCSLPGETLAKPNARKWLAHYIHKTSLGRDLTVVLLSRKKLDLITSCPGFLVQSNGDHPALILRIVKDTFTADFPPPLNLLLPCIVAVYFKVLCGAAG